MMEDSCTCRPSEDGTYLYVCDYCISRSIITPRQKEPIGGIAGRCDDYNAGAEFSNRLQDCMSLDAMKGLRDKLNELIYDKEHGK